VARGRLKVRIQFEKNFIGQAGLMLHEARRTVLHNMLEFMRSFRNVLLFGEDMAHISAKG
jgi:hypothetical protein